jgi:hypothetical protein
MYRVRASETYKEGKRIDSRANDDRVQVARVPTPRSPDGRPVPYGITDSLREQVLGIKDIQL